MSDAVLHLGELVREVWLDPFGGAGGAAHSWWSWSVALRALAALWLMACALLACLRVVHWLLPRAGLPLRWSTVLSAGMWIATMGFHALRCLHAFDLLWALVACSALAAAAVFAFRERTPLSSVLARERRALRALTRGVRRDARVLVGAFLVFGALLAVRGLVVPPLGWDTITYHGPRAAQWVQDGKFTFDDGVGPFDFYRHFFAGGEVLSAWAMLPFHSDLLVNLGSVVQWVGVGLASWALARAIGLREPYAGTSACVVMFASPVQLQVGTGYVELALNTALITGIALAVQCLRRPSPGAVVLCGMALGVAAGIKLPGVPPGVIVAGVLLVRVVLERELDWRTKTAALGVAGLCALLPAVPWLFRAWRDTGYPLSPMPVQVLGIVLGVASPAMRWYQHRPGLEPFTWPAEKEALLELFAPLGQSPATFGCLGLLPWLVFPIGVMALARRRPLLALTLGAASLAPVLAHFGEGLAPIRLLWVGTASRFLIPAFALVVPLSLAWCRRGSLSGRCYAGLLLACAVATSVSDVRLGWGEWETREVAIVSALLALTALVVRWWAHENRVQAAWLAVTCWMVGCSVLQLRRDETRAAAYTDSFALHDSPRFWSGAVSGLDEPEHPRRIAITGGPDRSSDKWFHYFFMGSRLQNTIHYVIPTRDGGVAHVGPFGDLDRRADFESWLRRLRAAGISEVLSFPPRSIEQGWMESDGRQRFEKLHGTDEWGVFRLER